MDLPPEPKLQLQRPSGRRAWPVRIVALLSVGWCVFLLGLFLSLKNIGERNWILSILVFVPPQVWLLPTVLLALLGWRLKRRWFWFNLLVLTLIIAVFMNFRWALWTEPEGKTLRVVTNNIGGRKTRTIWPFLEREKPDVILYQDAWHHGRNLSKENAGSYVASRGQFCIVSKYEVKSSGVVPNLLYRNNFIAAWFEIDFHGTPVVIYNIHLPTPRPDLVRLRGQGLLAELVGGGGIYSSEVREQYKQALETRHQMIRDLLAWLEREKRPCLIAGDFNAPSIGSIYQSFADRYEDAFAAEGKGFGFTFPSVTRNPITVFGPWMRLDYVFADKHWQAVYCRVEPRQPAEHRAVSARFELKKQK